VKLLNPTRNCRRRIRLLRISFINNSPIIKPVCDRFLLLKFRAKPPKKRMMKTFTSKAEAATRSTARLPFTGIICFSGN